jgi:hypothetical protein
MDAAGDIRIVPEVGRCEMNQDQPLSAVRLDRSGDAGLGQLNAAFKDQISNQISRITAELGRMEDLLKFGMVDRRVLTAFRSAIDRVRSTGWKVERWLDRDERGLSVLLAEERIRVLTNVATQLTSERLLADDVSGFRALRDSVRKLCVALDENDRNSSK